MKALVQRVASASVGVDGKTVGHINRGLLVFLGVSREDSKEEARYLANKIANLRIFPSEEGEFDLSALEIGGEFLVVSQFTLLADSRKGRRPSFTQAAPPDRAKELYDFFIEQARSFGLKVETGVFQQHMLVEINNDGPVTIWLESIRK
jgi:D-tyrosyl-tRNA(Tyr) deacylase